MYIINHSFRFHRGFDVYARKVKKSKLNHMMREHFIIDSSFFNAIRLLRSIKLSLTLKKFLETHKRALQKRFK